MAQTGLLDVIGEGRLCETTTAGVQAFERWSSVPP
jgi:hypothetical protein